MNSNGKGNLSDRNEQGLATFSGSGAPVGERESMHSGPLSGELGQYHLIEPIGRGGMGVVYKAWHSRLKRTVALKVLPSEHMVHPTRVSRFEREMEAIGNLDHPAIVRAYDAGCVNGVHYLAMEFVEGLTVAELIRGHGRLARADACELIRQAAVGLQYIHEQGRVHRDLKPSNLMLTPHGTVKILDLGLASLRELSGNQIDITNTGQPIGTVDYMAPEQVLGDPSVDVRADIYSLACTLHHLMRGIAPFNHSLFDTSFKRMRAHVEMSPPRLDASMDPDGELSAILARAMAKSAADRYASPRELAEALAPLTHSADLPALVGAVDQVQPAATSARSSLVVTHSSAVSFEKLPRNASRSDQPGSRTRAWLLAVAAVVAVATAAALFRNPRSTDGPPTVPKAAPVTPAPVVRPLLVPMELDGYRWHLLQGSNGFELHAKDHALLEVGQIDKKDFNLNVELRQLNWTGGVGVFFGYQPEFRSASGPCEFQVISLLPGREGQLTIERSFHRTGPASTSVRTSSSLARAIVDIEDALSHRLQIRVRDGVLAQVSFNGQILPALSASEIQSLSGLGRFGGYASRGTAEFVDFAIDDQVIVVQPNPSLFSP